MVDFKKNGTWKEVATNIVYKDPYSETTIKHRRNLIFWTSITILNRFYPIDIEKSHILGLSFQYGKVPPVNGILGLITIYLVIIFAVYVYQEIRSWFAQAEELKFSEYQRVLVNAVSHHGNLVDQAKIAASTLKQYNETVRDQLEYLSNLDGANEEDYKKSLHAIDVFSQNFGNSIANFEKKNDKYGEEIQQAKEILISSESNYASAMRIQMLKVFGLELLLPSVLGVLSIIYVSSDTCLMIVDMFND